MNLYRNYIKRIVDFNLAAIGLLAGLPVLIILSAVLIAANKGTPFFVQYRPGRKSKIFRLIKFKTMNDRKDASGKLLPDADRLTAIGKLIRSLSLDELPQLINVLNGDMSVVGPRPLLEKYLPLYTAFQARRHEVRPGITGWTQVNGRNALSWEKKFELDVWYVDHVSFALDMKILWMTVFKVLKRTGITQEGQATMEAFQGSKERERLSEADNISN